jgi:tetratricopeptide (TPR) repeat protein
MVARTRKSGILLALLFCANAFAQTAEEHYRRGVEYGEQAMRASIFRRAGLAIKAREEFERAVRADPNFLDARFALLEFDLQAPAILGGSEEKAVAQANEIKARDAVQGHHAFAMIYAHKKKYELARKEYVDAVALDPSFMTGWFEIGHLAALSGANLAEGEAAMRKYIESPASDDPPLFRAHYWLGVILEKEGKKAEADEQFRISKLTAPKPRS